MTVGTNIYTVNVIKEFFYSKIGDDSVDWWFFSSRTNSSSVYEGGKKTFFIQTIGRSHT